MEIKEIITQKITLEPGEVLVVTLKIDDDIEYAQMRELGDNLRSIFPDNKVVVFRVGSDQDIQLTTVKDSSYNDCSKPDSYCQDCSCGKKERAQNETDKVD
jgi:hypothetical protein